MSHFPHLHPRHHIDDGAMSMIIVVVTLAALIGFTALVCNYLPWS